MKHDNRDAIDFANEPVGRLFRKMIVPTLVSMVSMVILNLTDGAFIGHGAGSDALAAINIAAPIFNLLAGVGIMFGIGCSVVASIHLAQGKVKSANINITQALIGALGITMIICGLMRPFQHVPSVWQQRGIDTSGKQLSEMDCRMRTTFYASHGGQLHRQIGRKS